MSKIISALAFRFAVGVALILDIRSHPNMQIIASAMGFFGHVAFLTSEV